MPPKKDKTALRIRRFEEVCANEGIKLTLQRLEIIQEIARAEDHPDAETVHQRVREKLPTVSLDTVYRTLWLLNRLGLITILGPTRERTRFDANLNRHHHFECGVCGEIRDFYSDELNNLELPESIRKFGHVETAQVELRGICHACAQKEKQE